ncbi:hypothetical protein RvY_04922 [Ramazzottius varieornatus]|uniref:Nucleotide-diphospho-sugar transferase domain-containing protein n=1 Tax=Ramazzottius varieornatus TaxID=947166 RepID=A0A1D1V2E9_RAMVA|nr:hypothetical protein RvY_04922 [Ramazzottius varieornatus]
MARIMTSVREIQEALHRLVPENRAIDSQPVVRDVSPLESFVVTFNELDFLNCMSILSVLVNLLPATIFIHTNLPTSHGHWGNASCNRWIKLKDWSNHGGLSLDFDVYIINGALLRHKLSATPCLSYHENPGEAHDKLNPGFLGCLQTKAEFPGRVLELYRKDFRPDKWLYNSGQRPLRIMHAHPECDNNAFAAISLVKHKAITAYSEGTFLLSFNITVALPKPGNFPPYIFLSFN